VEYQQVKDKPPIAELLLDEFTHRINNELAAMIAIVSRERSINHDEATGRALKRVHTRLMNVGWLQHALHGPRCDSDLDAAHYLRQLCESRRAMLEDIELRFAGRSVILDAERCRRVGMIVSELIENARKHAFSDAASGSISVELSLCDGWIECRVSDNGRGSFGASSGRGLSIVHALANSLNGSLSRETGGKGTAWLLAMPAGASKGPTALLGG
jgi:two-component sensor histidine kinase